MVTAGSRERERLLRGIIQYRRALQEIKKAADWERCLGHLSEMVRLYASVGCATSDVYRTILLEGFEEASERIDADLGSMDPELAASAQLSLWEIASRIGILPRESPNGNDPLSRALITVATHSKDAYLRLLIRWTAVARMQTPDYETAKPFIEALRETRLYHLEAVFRRFYRAPLPFGIIALPPGEQQRYVSGALQQISRHSRRISRFYEYSLSLAMLLSENHSQRVLKYTGIDGEGESLHKRILLLE